MIVMDIEKQPPQTSKELDDLLDKQQWLLNGRRRAEKRRKVVILRCAAVVLVLTLVRAITPQDFFSSKLHSLNTTVFGHPKPRLPHRRLSLEEREKLFL